MFVSGADGARSGWRVAGSSPEVEIVTREIGPMCSTRPMGTDFAFGSGAAPNCICCGFVKSGELSCGSRLLGTTVLPLMASLSSYADCVGDLVIEFDAVLPDSARVH